MIKQLARLLPIAAAAVLALPALAGTVTLSNITGTWYDETPINPGGTIAYSGGGTGAPKVRWGDPSSGDPADKSGYNFDAVGGSIVSTLPPSPTDNFKLGTFQHQNFPIAPGTSIDSIKLEVKTKVVIDGNDLGVKTFVFDFDHNETTNDPRPSACADGGTYGVGVNTDGCADSVKVDYNTQSDTFLIGTDEYTLNVFGFSFNEDGTNPFTEWWTAEKALNTAYLVANISLKTDVGPPDEIPEPSTFALAGLAMLGLAAARRRKAS